MWRPWRKYEMVYG